MAAVPHLPNARVSRRWRLFGFPLLLALLLVYVGWLGPLIHRARRQASIIDRVEQLGGRMIVVDHTDAPRWLQAIVGPARFGNMWSVELINTRASAADLAALAEMGGVLDVYLYDTAIGDEAIPLLKKMPGLQKVGVKGAKFTDQGIRDLQQAFPMLTIYR